MPGMDARIELTVPFFFFLMLEKLSTSISAFLKGTKLGPYN